MLALVTPVHGLLVVWKWTAMLTVYSVLSTPTPSQALSARKSAAALTRQDAALFEGLEIPRWMREGLRFPTVARHSDSGRPGHQEWLGHWDLESSENDKAEQAMRAEGVPYLARRVAMRFKPERRFVRDSHSGELVGELKAVTGAWTEMSTSHPSTSRAGGFAAHSVSTWENDGVLCTVSTVKGPMGGTKVTTTRHYIEGGRLVSETSSSGGSYKSYFKRRATSEP